MSDPKPEEFVKFLELLTDEAPPGYEPWLFRVEEGTKAPDTRYGSWKKEEARLSKAEAVEWMEAGGNVGIAGRGGCPGCGGRASAYCPRCEGDGCDDALINVDIDDEDETDPDDLKPTLMARSRSRTGVHAWYFEAPGAEIPNIPTDNGGEVRANWQYVVAPGSYVETDPEEVPEDERDNAGYYTLERTDPVTSLRPDELPAVFREENEPDPEQQEVTTPDVPERDSSDDNRSALFDIEARDVVLKEGGSTNIGDRWASLFHGSETGKNMSLSDEGLLHCWRHEVAHNGLQALAVLSEYSGGCKDVGSGHKHSGAGDSCFHTEDGAHIWHAWKYAKENGYIPDDDPVPYSALKHLCRERDLCAVSELPTDEDETIPAHAYDAALSTISNHDELNPGREKTDEFDDSGGGSSTEATATDGGATAAAGGSASTGDSPPPLAPPGVMQKAFADPYGRLERDPDGRDPTVHDLRNAEAATYVWDVLEDRDDRDVMAVSDGTFRAFERGVWRQEGGAGEQRLREYGSKALRSFYSTNVLEQLKEETETRNKYHVDELGIDEPWIVAGDTALNLNTRETRPVERDDLAIRRIDAEFDPDAEPDLWLDFLSRVAASPETIQKLQEYFGYTLWLHGQPFGKGLFLVGDTDSGKGTALKTLSSILGPEENVANETLKNLIGSRWGKAQLYGRIVNIRNEVTPGGLQNVQEFKELLGGADTVTAERKGKEKFDFTVTQKFIFATNQFPDVENADDAFWNRCLFARFPETIPQEEQRPEFHDELLAERSGILNWMLDGLDRLFDQGGFTGERTLDEKRNIAEEVGSPLERLKQEALTITREPTDLVHARDLYDLATAYAEEEGIGGGVPSWQGGAFTSSIRAWPGVESGRSRRFDDSGDDPVFKGVRVDAAVAKRLNIEVRTIDETPDGQTGLDV